MKALTFLLVFILSVSCQETKTDNESVISSNPYLVGNWSGEGIFFNKDFNKEIGKVLIDIKIKDNYELSGIIADAELIKMTIAKVSYGFEIKGRLNSKIKKNSKMSKDYLIILLVLPKEDRGKATVSDANFHLKSNYALDLDMRVGGVSLKKR